MAEMPSTGRKSASSPGFNDEIRDGFKNVVRDYMERERHREAREPRQQIRTPGDGNKPHTPEKATGSSDTAPVKIFREADEEEEKIAASGKQQAVAEDTAENMQAAQEQPRKEPLPEQPPPKGPIPPEENVQAQGGREQCLAAHVQEAATQTIRTVEVPVNPEPVQKASADPAAALPVQTAAVQEKAVMARPPGTGHPLSGEGAARAVPHAEESVPIRPAPDLPLFASGRSGQQAVAPAKTPASAATGQQQQAAERVANAVQNESPNAEPVQTGPAQAGPSTVAAPGTSASAATEMPVSKEGLIVVPDMAEKNSSSRTASPPQAEAPVPVETKLRTATHATETPTMETVQKPETGTAGMQPAKPAILPAKPSAQSAEIQNPQMLSGPTSTASGGAMPESANTGMTGTPLQRAAQPGAAAESAPARHTAANTHAENTEPVELPMPDLPPVRVRAVRTSSGEEPVDARMPEVAMETGGPPPARQAETVPAPREGEAAPREEAVMPDTVKQPASSGQQPDLGMDLSSRDDLPRRELHTASRFNRAQDAAFELQEVQHFERAEAAAGARRAAETLSHAHVQESMNKAMHFQELVDRFDEHVTSMVTGNIRTMTVTLVPRELGEVTLNCREEGAQMVLEIVAERPAVCDLLRQQESDLRQILEQSGYQLSQFDVHSRHDRQRRQTAQQSHGTSPGAAAGMATAATEATEGLQQAQQDAWRAKGGVWYVA
jgi:hypothetical protein